MNPNDIPAFPAKRRVQIDKYLLNEYEVHGGMTLRDYFAAKALQGLLADEAYGEEQDSTASWCYAMADAMLVARGA